MTSEGGKFPVLPMIETQFKGIHQDSGCVAIQVKDFHVFSGPSLCLKCQILSKVRSHAFAQM